MAEMKIAILAAMDKELRLIENALENRSESETEGVRIVEGKIGRHSVIASKCGIGKVNSALRTHIIIEKFHPDLVLNSGVAGGADLSMEIGTVLVADSIAYHDVWCGPGTDPGQADGCPLYFEADKEVVGIAGSLEMPGLRKGLICTGDEFISKASEIEEIKGKFPQALAVDMESASIAQACHMAGVPVAVIRVVSDTPGSGDNISQYKNFWSEAPEKTFRVISEIVSRLGETRS